MEHDYVYILISLAAVLITYLSGSVNYAIIVTRLVAGKDIRELGNRNPGMSNVGRTIGKPWGALVMILDALKVIVPLVLARIFLFSSDAELDFAVLYLMGIAGVVGHCLPVFYHFKGGGGIGPMQGVSLFFIPLEYLVSMFIGGVVVIIFVKRVQHKYTQWTPIMFVILTPFLALLTTLTMDIRLFAHISIGGHPWAVVCGAFALSLIILGLNIGFMRSRARELKEEEDNSTGPDKGL